MYLIQLLNITGSTVEALFTDAIVKSWSKRINGPGRFVFSLPVESLNATSTMLQKFKRVKLLRRKQDGTGTDETIWYGYIEAHKRTSPEEYTIYCVGMLQLFKYRYTAKEETFGSVGGSSEAFGLLTDTNSGDGNTGISSGTGGVATVKNVKATGRRDILGMWEELAKAHDAEFEITDAGLFNFVPSLGTDKTSTVTLRYRTDGQAGNNVHGLEEGEDGSPLRNKIIGTNSAGTFSTTKQDATSQSTYGVLVEVKVFNEAQDATALEAITQAYLDQVKQPIPDFGAKPVLAERKYDIVTNSMVVEGFQYGDVVPGDLVTCEILTANQSIQTSRRVVEVLVDVDANLRETVQYTLAESGVSVSVGGLASKEVVDIKDRLLKLEQGAGGSGSSGGSTASFVDKEVPAGSINGSNTVFTVASTPVSGSEHVYLNGVLQQGSGSDYTASGVTITFVTAPPSGSVVLVSYRTSSRATTFADKEVPSGTINGSNTAFTLAHPPTTGSLHLFLNGILQNDSGGSDYSLSATTITFVTAPPSGSTILASYRY